MSSVTTHIAASPDEVFAVLSNGWYYSNWVVGTSHMRAVEADWPAPGARLFHASGIWPAALRDETQVEQVSPGERLVLIARGRPFGEARVEVIVAPEDGGTRVTLNETPIKGPGAWLHNPVSEAVLQRRNVESLARLAAIAENRARPDGPS
jgi:uncharacterized protein YndB with AHSA1/START domain